MGAPLGGGRHLWRRVALSWWLPLLMVQAHADPYGEAWTRAAQLEADGDVAGAFETLHPWRERYPQDFSLALQLGWLAFQAERWPEAEVAYRAAVDLSGGAPDAVLGLAWTLLRLGDRGGARALLGDLDPTSPGVSEAWSAAAPTGPSWTVTAATGLTVLPPDSGPTSMVEVRAAAAAVAAHARGGLDLVASAYTGVPRPTGAPGDGARRAGNGPGPGGPGGTGTDPTTGAPGGQPDFSGPSGGPWSAEAPSSGWDVAAWAHLAAGGRVGGEAVAAVLLQTAPDVAPGFVAGGVVRAAVAGEVRLEASFTRPRGGASDAVRVAPSWWIPVGPFALAPEGALQHVAGDWLPSAGGTGWWLAEGAAVWAGGRGGPQRTASSLALRSTAAWPDLDRAGAWAGLRVGRLDGTWASAAWSAAWLDPDADGSAAPRPSHTVTATLHTAL